MFIYTHLSRWKIKRNSIQWFIYCVVCWDFSNIGVCYKREPSLVIIVALQKLKIKSLQTPTHDTYLKGTYLNRDEFVQRTQPTPRDFSSALQHSHLLFKDKCKNIFILSDVKKYLLKTIFLGWTKIYTYTSQEGYKAAAIYYASIVAWRTEVIHCIARLWGPPCLRRGPSEAPTVCVCVCEGGAACPALPPTSTVELKVCLVEEHGPRGDLPPGELQTQVIADLVQVVQDLEHKALVWIDPHHYWTIKPLDVCCYTVLCVFIY